MPECFEIYGKVTETYSDFIIERWEKYFNEKARFVEWKL